MSEMSNPLLNNLDLPRFHDINAEAIPGAVDHLLEKSEQQLQSLEQNLTKSSSFDTVVGVLEEIERNVSAVWGPVSHLVSVKNSPELREAYQAALPKLVAFGLRMSQSQKIYDSLKNLTESAEWSKASNTQIRIVEKRIKEAELSGLNLTGDKRERFNEISEKLSNLSTQFTNNVLDATKSFELVVTRIEDLDGVPANFKAMWSENYKARHEYEKSSSELGPWAITLDFASYEPFMRYCTNRALREKLYRGHVTKASYGDYDNSPLIRSILSLRKEMAQLLGFDSYAQLSTATKMAGTVEKVETLLEELTAASKDPAKREFQELNEFAQKHGLNDQLANWDVTYYSEKLKKELFDYSDEILRPYFPLPKVLSGLFDLVHRIFGIVVKENQDSIQVWHKDVKFYDVFDDSGKKIAAFFLDPYSRPENKNGGAWMNTCIDRGYSADGTFHTPVAYLVCNGTPPTSSKPSLLSFREVETLFHEFGHGLQHMLTTVNHSFAAGINGVEWDAVELPSQFMENWCYHKPTLISLTEHVDTGEQLPDELYEKIVNSRNFLSALAMVRQLHFATIDITVHHKIDPNSDIDLFQLNREIAANITPQKPIDEDRFLCSFSHIFAGGYAAGYYSYKWAEVLSADAFAKFEEEGLDNTSKMQTTGKEFRDSVLALGGSMHPMDVFKKFRGREPNSTALLRHSGLANNEVAS